MGMIADELERSTIIPLKAIMALKRPLMLEGHHFTANTVMAGLVPLFGGPLMGVAQLDTTLLYQQLDELTKALENVAKAVRKLEDDFNKPKLPMRPIISAHRR